MWRILCGLAAVIIATAAPVVVAAQPGPTAAGPPAVPPGPSEFPRYTGIGVRKVFCTDAQKAETLKGLEDLLASIDAAWTQANAHLDGLKAQADYYEKLGDKTKAQQLRQQWNREGFGYSSDSTRGRLRRAIERLRTQKVANCNTGENVVPPPPKFAPNSIFLGREVCTEAEKQKYLDELFAAARKANGDASEAYRYLNDLQDLRRNPKRDGVERFTDQIDKAIEQYKAVPDELKKDAQAISDEIDRVDRLTPSCPGEKPGKGGPPVPTGPSGGAASGTPPPASPSGPADGPRPTAPAGPPPAKPKIDIIPPEPKLEPMSAPAPSPFCSAEQRNAYLTEVQQPASARALENVARANGYLDQLNALYAAQSAAGAAVPTLIAIHAAIEAYQPVAAAQQRESAEVNALYAAALAEPVGASCPSEVASGPPPEPPPSPSDGKVPCPDRKPITVGRNRQVGSGAQMRQKAMSTALGLVGGLIGGGGSPLGGGGGGSDGPQTVKCRIADREMTVFDDPESGISLKVGAKRTGDSVLVYAGLGKAPDAGTFQSAFLERGDGAVQGARDVGICDLWGEWKLTVSWTRTTYVNNQMVSRESGGWSKSGDFRIPGILSAGQAPDGLWKRLGFSNASHGARRIVLQYALPRGSAEPVDVVIHVTRPGGDPVITAPFVLRMREGPAGFVFERAPSDCPETATAG